MRNGIFGLAASAMLLFVAGCGGSGTPSTAAAPETQAPAAESSAPAGGGAGASSQPSAEASAAGPASAAPAGGGGTAAGVCELVTADELAGIFGVAGVKTTVIPGPPDNCIVESDTGDPLSAWSLSTAQAQIVFDALTSDPSSVDVTGIGDKAAFVQNTGLLVLKGGKLVVVSISGGSDMSEEEVIEASKQVGTFAASRL